MRTLRTVVLISAVFVVVGPVVGAVVIWLERPPGSFGTVVLLSYAFGGVPALIAGIVYGAASVRGRGAPSPVSGWTVGDLENSNYLEACRQLLPPATLRTFATPTSS